MKKIIVASCLSLALTGNAMACGELPAAQASKKPEVKVASKAEAKALNGAEAEVIEKAKDEASNTPEAKAE